MNRKLAVLVFPLLTACGPTPLERQAAITRIAEEVIRTQTALAPTATVTPSPTRTQTCAPPTETPTPLPPSDLTIQAMRVDVYAGPPPRFGKTFHLIHEDQVQIIGRNEDCSWLKVETIGGREGWIANRPEEITWNEDIECEEIPFGVYRPKSGFHVIDKRSTKDEDGKLRIENGLAIDSVVVLADLDQEPVYGMYVRSHDVESLEHIPDGSYRVFFTTGEDWLAGENRFSKNAHYQRFERLLTFSGATTWEITLHPVPGGQATTRSLSEEEFPSFSE